jgi:hypothetical protein
MKSAVLLALLLPAFPQDPLPPEPPAAEQKEKLKVVRDLFKTDYAKKAPADQQALARELLKRGTETRDDAVAAFVMLKEAREIAAATGDVETALKAADAVAAAFAVPRPALKLAALAKAAALRDPEVQRAVGRAALALVDEAVQADDYETATAAAGAAEKSGRAAADPQLPVKAQEAQRDLASLKTEFQKVKAELDKASPADGEATGRYLCFVRGAWEKGLPHLSASAKAPLQGLAAKDLAGPTEPEKQLELADGWYELAQKEKNGWRKGRILARAMHWYEQCSAAASGLTKVKVEKRLTEIEDAQPGSVNLIRLADPKLQPYGEWTVEGGALLSPSDPYTRVLIPYSPPEEFDLSATIERRDGADAILFGMVRGSTTYAVWIDGWSLQGGKSGLELVDGILCDKNPASVSGMLVPAGKPMSVLISVRKKAITATLDGKTFVNFQGDFGRLNGLNTPFWKLSNWKGLYVGTCGTRFRISKLSLAVVSGQGKKIK